MGNQEQSKDQARKGYLLVSDGVCMKVCVIGTRGFPEIEGGVEKHCESLYPLFNQDIETIVFRRKSYVASRDSTYSNIKFIDLPSTRIKGLETVIHSFLATLRALWIKPAVVHYHNIGPALFAPLLKLRKIPVVLTYHSPNYEHEKWGVISRRLLKFSESVALKFSDGIIFVNKYQMHKYPPDIQKKSVYLPNGINKPLISEKQDYLNELGVEPKKYILSVGRITPEKGFDTLIKAYKRIKHKDYKLVIAGGVEFESEYKEKLLKLVGDESVIFTGYVFGEKLAELYTNAALYVLSSNNEGFPLVLLEAMSYKLDIIASDIPAAHLAKLNDDDYFPKGDFETLGVRIDEKLSEPKSRDYDLKEYDWKQIANRVSDIYADVNARETKKVSEIACK